MRIKNPRALGLGLIVGSFAIAAALPTTPTLERPGSANWAGHSTFAVDRDTSLHADTIIRADEVILKKNLVTHGYALSLECRKLIFEGGRITAFNNEPAPARNETQAPLPPPGVGRGGADQGDTGKDGGPGYAGSKGAVGIKGVNGMQNPGAITIFAGAVVGTPTIDGQGQTGGTGGRGGQGQRGGGGGKGGPGEAGAWPPWKAQVKIAGGKGGPGGPGGPGGQGGPGGDGGAAVAVKFYVAYGASDPVDVQSVPGKGGTGGAQGHRGKSGDPGQGGKSDSSNGFLGGIFGGPKIIADPGKTGIYDASGDEVSDQGVLGTDSTLPTHRDFETFDALENLRFETSRSWFEYHWTRMLEILLEDSIRLTSELQRTRAELASNAGLAATLAQANAKSADRISRSWKTYFVEPLQSIVTSDEDADDQNLLDAVQIGTEASEAFLHLAQGGQYEQALASFKGLLKTSRLLSKTRLSTALRHCRPYNELRQTTVEKTFGITSHFRLPVCEDTHPERFLLDEQKEIVLARVIDPTLKDPKETDGTLISTRDEYAELRVLLHAVEPRPLNALDLHGARGKFWPDELLGLFAPSAANAADQTPGWIIEIIDGKPFSPKLILENTPLLNRTIERNGLLFSYGAPAEKDVVLDTLAYYLRTAAVLAGARK